MSDQEASPDANERLSIPLHEEVVEPRVQTVETGSVRVHKRVETVPVETTVETARDEVTVERVPVDRPVDTPPEPRQEGDTLVIPVLEEVVVTTTRLMVREEVRITRRRVTEQTPVRTTARRETVEINQPQPGTPTAPTAT